MYVFELCWTLVQEAMSVEPAPKVFIQNKLRRSRDKLAELVPLIDSKRASE